jgi:hypothetical protein
MKTKGQRLHHIAFSLTTLFSDFLAEKERLTGNIDELSDQWETDDVLHRLYTLRETLYQMIAVVDNGIAYFKARHDLFKEVK